MSKVYVVSNQIGGFARDEYPETNIVGVYIDPDKAEKVKRVAGFGAKVSEIELDFVHPGLVQFAAVLGFKL